MKYIVWTTKPGDRWDMIAWRVYADPNLYAPIIEANRSLFATSPLAPIPTVLEAGIELRIPILDAPAAADDLPPWRRG